MAADPITAIANALTQAGVLAMPFIEEHFAQKYDQEDKERIYEFNKIMSMADPAARSRELDDFILRLVTSGGETVGPVDDTTIEVPLDYFTSLVRGFSKGIAEREINQRVQFKKG